MTAIFMDGFDHYGPTTVGTANMKNGTWADTQNVAFGVQPGPQTPSFGARTGQYALRSTTATGNTYRYVLPATQEIVYLSCGFAVDFLPGSNNTAHVLCFRDNTNAIIARLICQSTGVIALTKSDYTLLAQTQGPVVTAANWDFLEMKFDRAGGAFILRVNDATGASAPVINATGLSLGSLPVAQITVLDDQALGGVLGFTWLDDLFIRDTNGSVNNSFLGDRQIATLLANADTTTAGWTPNFYHQLGAGILSDTAAGACVSATTATNLNIGASDFTLEGFVRFQALPSGSNKAVIWSRWDETNNQRSYQLFLGSVGLNGGALQFRTSTDGTNATVANPIIYPWTPNLDQWYHIAVVRASNQDLLFVNGQQFGLPIADANTYFAGIAPFGLGGQIEGAITVVANTTLQGWFDEVRFTNGFARYTANFTPTVVEFPRSIGGDAHFANVSVLAGFDSVIQDESSFARTLTALNGAVQLTTNDGPLIGSWSTIGKAVPDDNTFLTAPFVAASSILTLTVNAGNNNTVTVGTKNGSIAAVYTFKTTLTGAAFEILIDSNIQNTLQNLFNAINAGAGAGTKYGTGTTANFDVNAVQLPAGQMQVIANTAGTAGNSIATSATGITGSWTSTTLAGGLNIPGPSNFKTQRLPSKTTLISAIQISTRAFKSDSGAGSINSALVGPLGGVSASPTHALTLSPSYYNDIRETDPDTGGAISPTTITNGAIQINRDT